MSLTRLATIRCADEAETRGLAARLAPYLRRGDVLLLSGPIGAGKSVFARALIQTRLGAAGRQEEVPSPSFTLVQVYDDADTEIWHADLYRLGENADIAELGLDEAFDRAITIVEWPERMGAETPPGALHVTITPEPGEEARLIGFASDDPGHWHKLGLAGPAADAKAESQADG
ncbi:MAG: tRNA (adenosine(37)-N6)-threonylcarbamoyltransferase complex ATPase subunit type 1 TsaE [Alphaproteobacteria bacterium]|nr:MAG: tRNA (adenosine(37)-N6)-threonylcarbamoyltransferase complex ATPase subunit type 1 TsaE [Alphaproteobacteria bacterium]